MASISRSVALDGRLMCARRKRNIIVTRGDKLNWEDDMKVMTTVGLAALALGLFGSAQAETIKVGVVLPYSGVNADLGNQIDKAFDLYVKLHE
jgi:ABC-type branched-subunit amino acid transport system substrate-binding protein